MYTDQAFPISASIFSENSPYLNNLNTSLLHPPVVVPVPPLSPASSEKSSYSYTSSSDEDFTFPMDQLNNVKKLLRMFPPPMSATEFIHRNPFLATDGHIKRPSNNFILFRKIAHDQKNQAQELSNYNERQWSQIVGKIWKTLSAEEKSAYKRLGEQVASIHHEMYPSYKYQPKRDKAAWKHFNPVENNKKLKNRRKNKVRQQSHQETTPEISYQNVSQQQQQIVSQTHFDFTAPAITEIPSNPELVFDGMFGNFDFNVNVNVNEVNDWINY